jgi:hypothetical protein
VVINEILTHTDLPAIDRIELYNPASTNVDIGGWFLTDDSNVPRKYRLPAGMVLPAGGYVVFDESQFNATPGTNNSFSLGSRGEQVYLVSADALGQLSGYSHGFSFGAAANGVSFGRYINSVGEEHFPAQIANTFGSANAGPRVGPVVINEIHYNPAAPLNPSFAYIELKNITVTNVPLFDVAHPTNTWRVDGLGFTFPTNITMPPQSTLMVVGTNPATFRAQYSLAPEVAIAGQYIGTLQRSGERISLERPDAPDTNGVPYIAVDTVRYNDKAPWPPAADGSGASLQRRATANYADDPINWFAAAPTPGNDNAGLDTDGDGVPDDWELSHGTDPNGADGFEDPDGDGFSNVQEYIAGTDPQSANSSLRFASTSLSGGSVLLEFGAASNRSYTISYKDTLEAPSWNTVTNIGSAPTARTVIISEPATNQLRFYRIGAP